MIKFVVFAAVISVALASSKKCPWIIGKYPFDESKFAGEWKVITGSGMLGGPHKCSKFDYSITKDIHSAKYSGIKDDGSKASGEFYGQAFGKDVMASTYLATWKKQDDSYSPLFKQSIVATDYDNYAILVACAQVFEEKTKSFKRVLKAGILSRNTTLDPTVKKTLESVLTSYDFDPSDMKTVDHTGC